MHRSELTLREAILLVRPARRSLSGSNERRRRAQQVLDQLSPAEESVLFGEIGGGEHKDDAVGNILNSPRGKRILRLEQMKKAMMDDPVFRAQQSRPRVT